MVQVHYGPLILIQFLRTGAHFSAPSRQTYFFHLVPVGAMLCGPMQQIAAPSFEAPWRSGPR